MCRASYGIAPLFPRASAAVLQISQPEEVVEEDAYRIQSGAHTSCGVCSTGLELHEYFLVFISGIATVFSQLTHLLLDT